MNRRLYVTIGFVLIFLSGCATYKTENISYPEIETRVHLEGTQAGCSIEPIYDNAGIVVTDGDKALLHWVCPQNSNGNQG